MNLSKYSKNTEEISLYGNQITEINWDGCPEGLESIDLNWNKITEMNWEGCPEGLKAIALSFNQITQMNWEGCPEGLKTIYPGDLMESYGKYKKTKEFLDRKTKPKRDINAEISANSMLPPDNKIKVFNNETYKENFYLMIADIQSILIN